MAKFAGAFADGLHNHCGSELQTASYCKPMTQSGICSCPWQLCLYPRKHIRSERRHTNLPLAHVSQADVFSMGVVMYEIFMQSENLEVVINLAMKDRIPLKRAMRKYTGMVSCFVVVGGIMIVRGLNRVLYAARCWVCLTGRWLLLATRSITRYEKLVGSHVPCQAHFFVVT